MKTMQVVFFGRGNVNITYTKIPNTRQWQVGFFDEHHVLNQIPGAVVNTLEMVEHHKRLKWNARAADYRIYDPDKNEWFCGYYYTNEHFDEGAGA